MSDNDGDDGRDEPFADLLDEIEGDDRESSRDAPTDRSSVDAPEPETEPTEEPDIDEEEVFTEESFDDVDTDELWDELEDDEEEDDSPEPAVGASDASADDGIRREGDAHVVPKRSFCQNCRHLTDPPEFRCTADGAEIVEFVDTERVRVSNCPIVDERQSESQQSR